MGKEVCQQWRYRSRSLKEKGASSLLTDTKHALFMLLAPHWTAHFSRRGLFSHLDIFTLRCLVQVAMQRKSVALVDEWMNA